MARDCEQLLPSTSTPLLDGADFILAETRLKFPVAEGQIDLDPEPGISGAALVSTVTGDQRRQSLHNLKNCFLSGRSSARVLKVGLWSDELLATLVSCVGDSFNLVFAIPGDDVAGVTQLHDFLVAVPSLECRINMVLLVTDDPSAFDDLTGIDGIVLATDDLAIAAAQVFTMVSALLAPETINCVGEEDILELFHAGDPPAQLAEAVWLPVPGRLVFATPKDEAIVAASRNCAFILNADQRVQWREVTRLVSALRSVLGPNTNLVVNHVVNFIIPSGLSSRTWPITLLCSDSPQTGE